MQCITHNSLIHESGQPDETSATIVVAIAVVVVVEVMSNTTMSLIIMEQNGWRRIFEAGQVSGG